jgi:hypothetical protein
MIPKLFAYKRNPDEPVDMNETFTEVFLRNTAEVLV